jgi:hypothetical protein
VSFLKKLARQMGELYPSKYRPVEAHPSGYHHYIARRIVVRRYPYPDSLTRQPAFVCLCGSQVFRKWQFVMDGNVSTGWRCWKCDGAPMLASKLPRSMHDALVWLGYRKSPYQV